jgi:DNA adenine methylase/adenine-specific DNA-methyltransferase
MLGGTAMSQTLTLFENLGVSDSSLPERALRYPQLRYMGSKTRLLPWIHAVLSEFKFGTALDAFSGSGCVSYLLKAMGKSVVSNDFLSFPQQIALATIENDSAQLTVPHCEMLCRESTSRERFVETTFKGIFFSDADRRFIDVVWSNLAELPSKYHHAVALASLMRACIKRQPRGVFTVGGSHNRYDDGRRDLKLPLATQFLECVKAYNHTVFSNGTTCRALRSDVMTAELPHVDLVYMDPPYVPRADDNCYIKRYHFLEGLASYWRDEDAAIDTSTKVRKIAKRYTPFSYRRTALAAFDQLFARFRDSIQILSYSSNGYPDLETLCSIMRRHKRSVHVLDRPHRYHFGTHKGVTTERSIVKEYLIIGE